MLRKRFCHYGCRRTQNARLAECRVSRRKAPVCVNRARSVFNKRRLKACRGRVKRRPRDTEVGGKPADNAEPESNYGGIANEKKFNK